MLISQWCATLTERYYPLHILCFCGASYLISHFSYGDGLLTHFGTKLSLVNMFHHLYIYLFLNIIVKTWAFVQSAACPDI